MSKVLTDECGNGSSQITTCSSGKVPDEGSSPQVSSEVSCDENAILKVVVSNILDVYFPCLPQSGQVSISFSTLGPLFLAR